MIFHCVNDKHHLDLCRVPQDRTRLQSCEMTLASHCRTPLRGMVCINHFSADDLIPATNSRPVTLKKEAIPKIFAIGSVNSAPSVSEAHAISPVQLNIENVQNLCQNVSCQYLRIQYDDLCQQHLVEKNRHDIEIQKMEKLISDLKTTNRNLSERIKSYDMRLKRNTESKEKLKSIVKELQKQQLIGTNAKDILKVKIATLAFIVDHSDHRTLAFIVII